MDVTYAGTYLSIAIHARRIYNHTCRTPDATETKETGSFLDSLFLNELECVLISKENAP